ncbi:hypothetical protein [Hymenobacter aerophilus]|uniref:hypothetical protein n=1 Tax=Hymenobacter aerophilus TaxID=119644 RepID=UPI0012F90490|nr:hypothetical protein [Hymenobacter aerophilus]
MTSRPFILLTLICTLSFISCNKSIPTGFWENYETNFLVNNISDQGPYGGHRAVYWKSQKPLTFDTKNILDFATKNGWTLVDSSGFSNEQTNKWIYDNEKIFPLTNIGFSDTLLNDERLKDFPRWFGGQVKLYKFKTGWVTIEPGTDNSIEENGFILLNQDKSEMAVYHLWGE